MKKLVMVSVTTLAIIGLFSGISYYNKNQIEKRLDESVIILNNKLPQGFKATLESKVGFNSGSGNYKIIYLDIKDKKEKILTQLDFTLNHGLLNLLQLNPKIPVQGVFRYIPTNKSENRIEVDVPENKLLLLNGYIEKNGNMKMKLLQNAHSYTLFEDNVAISKYSSLENNGYFNYINSHIDFNMNIPDIKIENLYNKDNFIKLNKTEISLEMDTKESFNKEKLLGDTKISIGEYLINSEDFSASAEGILAKMSLFEKGEYLIHNLKIKADKVKTDTVSDIKYEFDYTLSIPMISKDALMSFLYANDSDIKLSNINELQKNGFSLIFNKILVDQSFEEKSTKKHNSIDGKMTIHLNPEKEGSNIPERLSFNGDFLTTGLFTNSLMDLELIDFSSKDKLTFLKSIEDEDRKVKLSFDYKNYDFVATANGLKINTIDSKDINPMLLIYENLLKDLKKPSDENDNESIDGKEQTDETIEDSDLPPEIAKEESV
jgi:hypothetical protein